MKREMDEDYYKVVRWLADAYEMADDACLQRDAPPEMAKLRVAQAYRNSALQIALELKDPQLDEAVGLTNVRDNVIPYMGLLRQKDRKMYRERLATYKEETPVIYCMILERYGEK